MSAYRYVVFPRGRQPTPGDVRELKSFAGLLANHFAWGVCRDDGRLAIACEQAAFDHGREIDAGFDALVRKWEVRGCELVDHLGFVKNSAALRPAPTTVGSTNDGGARNDALRTDERGAAKQGTAHEAVARSLLGVQRSLERYAAFQRFAAVMPYLLMALGALATIAAGAYVYQRMENSGRERRQQTIERVVGDPLREPLAAEPTKEHPAAVESAAPVAANH
jgi:hypothetical protein